MWWDQPAWQRMPMRGPDYERYWDAFYERFAFKPSMTVYPGIIDAEPISHLRPVTDLRASAPPEWIPQEDRLTAEALAALREAFGDERLVVLNWQHNAL